MRDRIHLLLYHVLGAALALVILGGLSHHGISICPMSYILPIGCPFCGMTRAHLACLSGDIAGALSIHPLFFFGVPYLWLLFHGSIFFAAPKSSSFRRITLAILTAAFFLVYLIRLVRWLWP